MTLRQEREEAADRSVVRVAPGTDTQPTRDVPLDACGLIHQLAMGIEGVLGLREQPLAVVSEAHPARRALEEREPERVLERFDVPAHSRLAQVEHFRRARDAALTRHRNERLELVDVQVTPFSHERSDERLVEATAITSRMAQVAPPHGTPRRDPGLVPFT